MEDDDNKGTDSATTVETVQEENAKNSLAPLRRRRSGFCTVAMKPVAVTITEDDEDQDEDTVNNNSVPNGDLNNMNESPEGLERRRRSSLGSQMAEGTLNRFMDKVRRPSDATQSEGREDLMQSPVIPDTSLGRKLSVDSAGILKKENSPRRPRRKSVSFSAQNDIHILETLEIKEDEDEEEEKMEEQKEEDDDDESVSNKSLVPTFIYANRRPDFAAFFKSRILVLESLDISADLTVVGNILVNVSRLKAIQSQSQKAKGQRIGVGITYTLDGWNTSQELKAYMIRSSGAVPGLQSAQRMRFALPCSDLDIGSQLEFFLWCVDQKKDGNRLLRKILFEDDNEKQFYKVTCTNKLNPWAERAARELIAP